MSAPLGAGDHPLKVHFCLAAFVMCQAGKMRRLKDSANKAIWQFDTKRGIKAPAGSCVVAPEWPAISRLCGKIPVLQDAKSSKEAEPVV